MSKKKRLIILCLCGVLFLIITPYIVLYSIGYRIDFTNKKIVATGGIYVKAFPREVDVVIDSKIKNATGSFSGSVFIQNLLPKQHSVLIKKEGYRDYQKKLVVKGKEVIKLENVILFKKNIIFTVPKDNIDYFWLSSNNTTLLTAKAENKKIDLEITDLTNPTAGEQKKYLSLIIKNGAITDLKLANDSSGALLNIGGAYYSLDLSLPIPKISQSPALSGTKEVYFDPQNAKQIFFIKNRNLYSNLENAPLIKNVVSYLIQDQRITWLSYDGFLYEYNLSIKTNDKITVQIFPVKNSNRYKLTIVSGKVFLQENDSLFQFNPTTKNLVIFNSHADSLKISPNGQKILYCNDQEILYSDLNKENFKNVLIYTSSEKIRNCVWLNDDYVIFALENKIVISEIDIRGNVNTVDLPQTIILENGKKIEIVNPELYFNQKSKELYVLTQGNLLVSDKLIP